MEIPKALRKNSKWLHGTLSYSKCRGWVSEGKSLLSYLKGKKINTASCLGLLPHLFCYNFSWAPPARSLLITSPGWSTPGVSLGSQGYLNPYPQRCGCFSIPQCLPQWLPSFAVHSWFVKGHLARPYEGVSRLWEPLCVIHLRYLRH